MRRVVAITALFLCGLSACIIGPKQDDPAEDRALVDAGTIFADSTTAGNADTAAPPASDTSVQLSDVGALDSTDAATDAPDGADAQMGDADDAVVDGDAAEGG